MDNKKLLWIVTELFPPDETSTAYILGEIANIMVTKYNVKVICGPKIYDKRKFLDNNNKFELDSSIEVIRVKGANLDKNTIFGKALSFLLMSKNLYSMCKSKIQKEDKVLMVTNPAPLVLLMSRLRCRIGFEWHVLVHDVFPENTIPAGVKLPLYSLLKHMFDKAYAKADQLIAIGRDMAYVLDKKVKSVLKGTSKGPEIIIIENWGSINEIRPQPMPVGRIRLEYAGNIGRVQGLDRILKELPEDVELHLYGTGSMVKTLKNLNLERVFFHGPFLRSQQNDVLAACHISIVTLQDGMYGLGVPSKTYNILASGRPILYIGPKNSEIDMLVREEGIGYCGWPKKWDLEELKNMGKIARVLAERNYSKEMILNKYLQSI